MVWTESLLLQAVEFTGFEKGKHFNRVLSHLPAGIFDDSMISV